MLKQGAGDAEDAFHWPVLGTASQNGIRMRTVILRQFILHQRVLICHTDARAPKVQEIKDSGSVSWLFYHPRKKIQLRIFGHATLHRSDSLADEQWAQTKITSRLNYCAAEPPGTHIDRPSTGIPDFLLDKATALLSSGRGRPHFMVIAGRIESLDWLHLRPVGNRRACFDWDENDLHATWLIP